MITSFSVWFSFCFVLFYFWNVCFPFAKLFIFLSSFLFCSVIVFRLHVTLMELLIFSIFKKTSSLTYHANGRTPTKQIQIKPFSNIQMYIIFFPATLQFRRCNNRTVVCIAMCAYNRCIK